MTARSLAKSFPVYDFATYLELEANASLRHEFFHGYIYAMAGGSDDHSGIVVAAIAELNRRLRAGQCHVRQGDLKIVTPGEKAAFYPDASVFCGQALGGKALTASSPTLILEVLAPSTRNFDLNTKRKEYFRIPSLCHYLLLDSESMTALLYTRTRGEVWPKEPEVVQGAQAQVNLPALGITLRLRDLYRQTSLYPSKQKR